MKESTLLAIALILSLAGIGILYIISSEIAVNERSLDAINRDRIEEDVKIKGALSKVTVKDDMAFLELTQPSTISVILFKKNNRKPIDLKEGDTVEIIGRVEEYEGKPEVIANYVRLIS